MPSNQAAWLTAKSVRPLAIKSAPYTRPGKNEILVRNRAVAINPLDHIKQSAGDLLFSWIKYPFIMGSDLAGDVVEVGPGVTRFKVGDRVLAQAVGMDPKVNKSSESAFQEYTIIRTNLVSPIPKTLSYEDACVIPLGLSTAACGMYMEDYLALPYPSVSPKPTGKTFLVWGASTSVGSNAVQLAIASGFEVIATSSPKNFDYVKGLGATQVFDYRSPTAVSDIKKAFEKRTSAGAIAVGPGSLKSCMEIIGASKGHKFVAQVSVDLSGELPTTMLGMMATGMSMGLNGLTTMIRSRVTGVGRKFVFGSDLMRNDVGAAIYEKFLPEALAQGKFIAAPGPLVVGKGLETIQEAMDLNRKGVSAKKCVVTL